MGMRRSSTIVQQCIIAAVSAVPPSWVRWLLARAAIAQSKWKTPLFERVCSKLVHHVAYPTENLIVSNFGLNANLRCFVSPYKSTYAFGKFDHTLSERATFALVRELVSDCDEFIDVGAHEGAFTFLVHNDHPQVRLHWFEPDRQLAQRLGKNLAGNSIVACGSEMAVAERRGTATFYKNLTDDSSGSLGMFAQAQVTCPEMVETIPLTEYFRARGIGNALVKVDVEGAGENVWNGAVETSKAIRYLVIEMIGPEIAADLPARIIRETDFKAYYIRDFELIPSVDGTFQYVDPFWNWLFCRLSPSELAARLSATGLRVYDDPEILPSSSCEFCLTGAGAGQALRIDSQSNDAVDLKSRVACADQRRPRCQNDVCWALC
jgi:FkbM family methyltransferase